jgi:hypothetical protein
VSAWARSRSWPRHLLILCAFDQHSSLRWDLVRKSYVVFAMAVRSSARQILFVSEEKLPGVLDLSATAFQPADGQLDAAPSAARSYVLRVLHFPFSLALSQNLIWKSPDVTTNSGWNEGGEQVTPGLRYIGATTSGPASPPSVIAE